MRDKLNKLIGDLLRKHGEKIVAAIDAILILGAVLIVIALAEIGAAQ